MVPRGSLTVLPYALKDWHLSVVIARLKVNFKTVFKILDTSVVAVLRVRSYLEHNRATSLKVLTDVPDRND